MGKGKRCEKDGLKKGPWTPEEDKKLLAYIEQHGHGSWQALPAKAGLLRCGKSCRLRWRNYLRPDIKRGNFSWQEDQTIIQLHALIGNRWSAIATMLEKRTDNEIKNYWNTHLKKRLIKMGIDPVTHKTSSDALVSGQSKDIANLNHIAQWESARVEAETRLVRHSKPLLSNPYHLPMNTAAQVRGKPVVPLPSLKQPMTPPCLDILNARQLGEWTNPNTFLNSNVGNLESPTSPFHFSDNISTVHSTGFCKISVFQTTDEVENLKPHEVVTIKDKTNDKTEGLLLQEVESTPADVTGFLEGFIGDLRWDDAGVFNMTGLYDNNLGSFCCGNLEDNKKYWKAIL